MTKKKLTLILLVIALTFEFATTEYAFMAGTIGQKQFSEYNPVFYAVGKPVFWSLFFGFSVIIVGLFLYLESRTRGRLLTWAYLVVWGYTGIRLGLAVFNLWQLLR